MATMSAPGFSYDEALPREYTPASSVYEGVSIRPRQNIAGFRFLLRALNGCMHSVSCLLLVAVMLQFLVLTSGVWYRTMSSQAVALIVFLAIDTILDVCSLIRISEKWPGWALLVRLFLGVMYLVNFMIYIAFGHVFPHGYSYWGLHPSCAGPVVYLCLWLLGIWSLLHTTLHRHRVGRDVLVQVSKIASRTRHRSRLTSAIITPTPAAPWSAPTPMATVDESSSDQRQQV